MAKATIILGILCAILFFLLVLCIMEGCAECVTEPCAACADCLPCPEPKIINHTNTIYLNGTQNGEACPELDNNETKPTRLELIRRLKYYENRQVKEWNVTDCSIDLNQTKSDLIECEDELCWHNYSRC